MKDRPFIGKVAPFVWNDRIQGIDTPGLALTGVNGIAGHCTKAEAYALADRICDVADTLPEAPTPPARPRMSRNTAPPIDTSASQTRLRANMAQSIASAPRARLTAADGTEEQPLEATPAESE